MTEPAKTVITVPAKTLRMMLAGVLPHASADDTLPVLQAVKIEVRSNVLYLAATDRYTMAAARCYIPGSIAVPAGRVDALIGRAEAQRLSDMLIGCDGAAALVFDPAAGKLTADTGGDPWDNLPAGTWDTIALSNPEWPAPESPWRKMLYGLLDAGPAAADGAYGVEMRLLGRFGQIDRGPFRPYPEEDEPGPEWPEESARIRIVRAGTPENPSAAVLVTRGQWFIGAAMGSRLRDPDGAAPSWDDWAAACAPDAPSAVAEGGAPS